LDWADSLAISKMVRWEGCLGVLRFLIYFFSMLPPSTRNPMRRAILEPRRKASKIKKERVINWKKTRKRGRRKRRNGEVLLHRVMATTPTREPHKFSPIQRHQLLQVCS
jgi:hypothetical protein